MIIEELVALLGFEFDDADLQSFNKGVATAAKGVAVVTTAAIAGATAIFAFTKSIAETNDELGKVAQTLGLATSDLQGWIQAAELGGSTQNELVSSMENLSRRTSEAARGLGQGVEVFGLLGISATDANGNIKESSILLEEVADRVSQLGTQAEKLELLEKLGISSGLLLTLEQGSAALRKQREEAELLGFALSETATKDAALFNDELLRVTKIAGGVANAIGQGIMPEITVMLTAFKDWFIVNKDIIRQNISAFLNTFVNTIKIVFNILSRVVKVFDSLIQVVGGWKVALVAASVALFAFNAGVLLMPILIAALATAIFLLLEDIVTFFQGGQSALGDFLADFPLLEQAIRDVGKALGGIVNPFTFLETVDDLLQKITNKINFLLKTLGVGGTSLFGAITGGAGNITGLPTVPARPDFAANNRVPTSSNSFKVDIAVNGAGGNAKEIAVNVRKEFSDFFNQVNNQTQKDMRNPIKR